MDTQEGRFILTAEAGPELQGTVVYRSTTPDGKIKLEKCDRTEITDEYILSNFDNLAIPY